MKIRYEIFKAKFCSDSIWFCWNQLNILPKPNFNLFFELYFIDYDEFLNVKSLFSIILALTQFLLHDWSNKTEQSEIETRKSWLCLILSFLIQKSLVWIMIRIRSIVESLKIWKFNQILILFCRAQWSESTWRCLRQWSTFAGLNSAKNYWTGSFWSQAVWYFKNSSSL